MDTLERTIGQEIRRRREAAHVSQETLAIAARNAGLPWTRATVAAIELGRKQLTLGELVPILRTLLMPGSVIRRSRSPICSLTPPSASISRMASDCRFKMPGACCSGIPAPTRSTPRRPSRSRHRSQRPRRAEGRAQARRHAAHGGGPLPQPLAPHIDPRARSSRATRHSSGERARHHSPTASPSGTCRPRVTRRTRRATEPSFEEIVTQEERMKGWIESQPRAPAHAGMRAGVSEPRRSRVRSSDGRMLSASCPPS